MTKTSIIKQLKDLGYDKSQYWLITGAAMVVYGIKNVTNDIDIGCSSEMADSLQKQGFPTIRMRNGMRKICIRDDFEVFENWLYDKVVLIEEIPVISISGLLQMKKELGREKDLRDIALIEKFMK